MSDQSDLDGIELQASHGTRHSVRHDFPQPKSCLLAAGGLWRAIWLAGGIGWTPKEKSWAGWLTVAVAGYCRRIVQRLWGYHWSSPPTLTAELVFA